MLKCPYFYLLGKVADACANRLDFSKGRSLELDRCVNVWLSMQTSIYWARPVMPAAEGSDVDMHA